MPHTRRQRSRTKRRHQRQAEQLGLTVEQLLDFKRRGYRIMTNGNGNRPQQQHLDGIGQVQVAPVSQHIVQALQSALDRARRGEIHALLMCGACQTNLSTFDVLVIDNMVLGMMTVGAAQVAIQKICQGAINAQQQVPVSRIVRPPANMPSV